MEKIGKGGQGILYLARDLELGIYRAIKVLSPDQKGEASILKLLEFPYLPQMIDYVEQGEYCFLVMEYIRGRSLKDYLAEGKIFTVQEIFGIAGKVLEILIYLHGRKPPVYYGDMKPENLMLTEEGSLYLIDFGSAVLGYERGKYICYGTAGYAAPEQYYGRISKASDFFSFGKTLLVLCQKNRWKYMIQYPGLFFLIRKCCHTKEDKRWQSGEVALEYLKKIRPLSLRIWRGLVLATGIFWIFILCAGSYVGKQRKLPSLENAVSPVLGIYTSMDFHSGGFGVREQLLIQIENAEKRLMANYQTQKEQSRLLLLLAANSEIRGKPIQAEAYYQEAVQIQDVGNEGVVSYGLFLCRQNRMEESLELYQKWEPRSDQKTGIQERNLREWRIALRNMTDRP